MHNQRFKPVATVVAFAVFAATLSGCLSFGTYEAGKVPLAALVPDDMLADCTVAGKACGSGIRTRPESALVFRANGRVAAFDARVAIDDSGKALKRCSRQSGAVFRVWADGRVVWSSDAVREKTAPVRAHADLAGAKLIVLETTMASPWMDPVGANADWLDAAFTCEEGATLSHETSSALFEQLGILTPEARDEPQINGADIWGVRPGHPVIFRVATSGARPMRFTAKNLPTGVTLDDEKGILGGVAPTRAGNYDIEVMAANAYGTATRTIRLAVGETLALTPPMGWNSWNTLGWRLTAEQAKVAVRAMESSGLGDHGWSYVNLDDWWEMNNTGNEQAKARPEVDGEPRDGFGRIRPNPTFPDMKALTDYIHGFGFKAGLYSSPGPRTCGGCEGSYGHEMQDATTWAEWGFDYVKYDWCSYDEVLKDVLGGRRWYEHPTWRYARTADKEKPYRLMSECLRKQKRDIVHSFCQYGIGKAELWAREAGAQCWRCWQDLKDVWSWMELAVEANINAEYWRHSGVGCWADPDMMIVGQQYSFGFDHPTFLTPNEQYTHVSLWSMVSAPLLLGCDLSKLDDFTRSLLVNDEVIAINQDRLGRPARRIRHVDAESVWVRTLANGDIAVALVNRAPYAHAVSVSFAELGVEGPRGVRDLWRQEDEGVAADWLTYDVPPHATKLVRLTRERK